MALNMASKFSFNPVLLTRWGNNKGVSLSPSSLILLTATFITLADNAAFWSSLALRMDLLTLKGFGFALTFFSLIMGITAFFFLVLGQRYLLKPLLILFLFLSAAAAYFNNIGVVFDTLMVQNMLETIKDQNTNEAMELLSPSLLWHLFLFGLLPSIFIVLVQVRPRKILRDLLSRLSTMVIILAVIIVLVMLNFKYLTYFSRENRDLRMAITPIYPVYSMVKLIKTSHADDEIPFHVIGQDAAGQHSGRRRVGIMVVGETARADHFSLNGYPLPTNPLLEKQDVVSYTNAWSCGTSTAYSVPCMFSFLERKQYSPGKAQHQSNLLDVLETAGIKTFWRDNNSSCKGVCERTELEKLHHDPDPKSPFFNAGEYSDEILLEGLDSLIERQHGDMLIVLHTMGSHGPAYYKRYPRGFARFQPACESASPHECSDAAVLHAYDNTILYTDHVLNKLIEFLKEREGQYDSFMLYASDHGESLGEHGVYLHGLPYSLAPDAQTHIPIITWLSDGLKAARNLPESATKACAASEVSHDNLVHTLLGMFDVNTSLYRKDLDLLAGRCK